MKYQEYFRLKKRKPIVDKWKILSEEEIKTSNLTNYNIPILKTVQNYIDRNGCKLIVVDRPIFPISNLALFEHKILFFRQYNKLIKIFYNYKIINEYLFNKLNYKYIKINRTGPPKKLKKNYTIHEDLVNEFITIENGYRKGEESTEDYKNKKNVYLFGSSLVFSIGCNEKETLSSALENQIKNLKFKVKNRGVVSADFIDSCLAILDTEIQKGDIIILYGIPTLLNNEKNVIKKQFDYLDLSECFKRPHSYGKVFYDYSHINPNGNKIVSQLLAKKIKRIFENKNNSHNLTFKENEISLKIIESRYRAAYRYVDEDFPKYIEFLKTKFKPGINGIAAMNCNPFTLGHLHLVKTASKMVDTLYLFILEEDKSHFKFNQRFEMVKEGVKEISNVVVVPTGKYLVSSMTFPDYFVKENNFNPNLNVTYDFEIFLYYIAPTLNLKKRFIGTEPFCLTTSTQHEIMKETLPKNGVSVIEIKRLNNEFGPISASKVRTQLKNKDYFLLNKFLPISTIELLKKYDYLKNNQINEKSISI